MHQVGIIWSNKQCNVLGFFVCGVKFNPTTTKELFVQRNDAFATNLIGLLKSIKEREISEIRYSFGFDGLIRIFLDGKGKLLGEYTCRSEKTLRDFKKKLEIK